MELPTLKIQTTRLGITVVDMTSNRPRISILGTINYNEYGRPMFKKISCVELPVASQEAICWLVKGIDSEGEK